MFKSLLMTDCQVRKTSNNYLSLKTDDHTEFAIHFKLRAVCVKFWDFLQHCSTLARSGRLALSMYYFLSLNRFYDGYSSTSYDSDIIFFSPAASAYWMGDVSRTTQRGPQVTFSPSTTVTVMDALSSSPALVALIITFLYDLLITFRLPARLTGRS